MLVYEFFFGPGRSASCDGDLLFRLIGLFGVLRTLMTMRGIFYPFAIGFGGTLWFFILVHGQVSGFLQFGVGFGSYYLGVQHVLFAYGVYGSRYITFAVMR